MLGCSLGCLPALIGELAPLKKLFLYNNVEIYLFIGH